MFIEGMPLWYAGTNAWIVAPGGARGECVLIDAPPDPSAILARLAHHELRLVALISTHGHIDHVGGIAPVVEAQPHQVPVHLHDFDRHMLLDPLDTGERLAQALEQFGFHRPPEQVYGIDNGQRISGAGMTFTAIHTPGHTQGSTCFLLEVEDQPPILFSGDHLFKGTIGRTDLPGGSYDQLMESMAEKILPLDDEIRVLPGHGDVTTIGWERKTNPFLLELLAAD